MSHRKPVGAATGHGSPSDTKAVISSALEPELLTSLPDPPAAMTPAARECWREVGALVVSAGHLTRRDLRAFEAYCEHWAIWRRACAEVSGIERLTMTLRNGSEVIHPAVTAMHKAASVTDKLGERFMITPQARSRAGLGVVTAKERVSEFAEFDNPQDDCRR